MTCGKSQEFIKIYKEEPWWRSPCWSSFIVKLQGGKAYKKSQSKGYSGNFIKKRRLHRESYASTFLLVLKKLWTLLWIFLETAPKSSRPYMSCKKGLLKKFAKSTGKHLCQHLWCVRYIKIIVITTGEAW